MSAVHFRSSAPESAIEELNALLPAYTSLITVDGHSGVGKSRVAKALSPLRRSTLIQIDTLVVAGRPTPTYVPKVDRAQLAAALSSSLAQGSAVVDGLCIEHLVPARYGERFRIYVRSEANGDGLRDEIDRRAKLGTNLYHKRYNPEALADLVVTVPYQF
ncbi:hypothetical protein [Sinorhizobium fredii]|uniref:hypothetical protein n=1 Tax=Rhizobium fredii TaxID=380 RepID=UPI0012FD3135|nr:hypothetical protein [Sinorhizobium fredii]